MKHTGIVCGVGLIGDHCEAETWQPLSIGPGWNPDNEGFTPRRCGGLELPKNEDPSDKQDEYEYHGTTTCRSTPTTALPCLSNWESLCLRLRVWLSKITA